MSGKPKTKTYERIAELPLVGPPKDEFGREGRHVMRVNVDYSRGQYVGQKRGYSLEFNPMVLLDHSESCKIPDPRRLSCFLEEAKAFSAKRLATLAALLRDENSALHKDVYLACVERTKRQGAVYVEATQPQSTEQPVQA